MPAARLLEQCKDCVGRQRLGLPGIALLAISILLGGCASAEGDDEESTSTITPTDTFTADPATVAPNGSTTLSWSMQAANYSACEASGAWSGSKGISGSELVGPLTGTSVFTLTCVIGPFEIVAATKAVTVTVGSTPPPAPPTVSLSANPTSVAPNTATTLSWNSTNATGCEAFGDWSGSKGLSGQASSGPLSATSTFTLVCGGPGGVASQAVVVTVSAPPPPPTPTLSLSASPLSVAYNGSSTVSWSSTNADSCVASGDWSGTRATSGSQVRSNLTATSTFVLTCTGAGGGASKSVTVSVAPPPMPSVSLSASPSTVNAGGSSTLTWSSTNATSCTAGGASAGGSWSGSKPTSGSQSVGPIDNDSTFTLTCTGPGGNTMRPVTVTVQNVTGSADLSWVPPTTNEDGSLVSLTGFKIYRGSSLSNLQQIATVGANVTTYTANSLSSGTHYFAVTATSATGESTFSNIENKTIP